MQEIERKFLVISEVFKKEAFQKTRIIQGFLNSDPLRTVRVRVMGDKGYLTVKGISNAAGTTRTEWEKEITVSDAEDLLLLCEPGIIDKVRYEIKMGSHVFEVDVFSGDNEGLIVAEIELNSEDEVFERPLWLGKEVTGEVKYYNSQLSLNPFKNWEK